MAKEQRHAPEQIISEPREAEAKLAEGTAIARVCKDLGVTETTCCRRRRAYGGPKVDQARRPKELEKENDRLERLLGEAESGKAILKGAASGKC